ncbi:MAG: NAD-dependent epimerase/dehydratase family protein [Sideroxyarcus sp.]|nr:NAD-dependent epimerase/dehydratase family protein [Sideroxyarcus sp.]
MTGGAGFIGSHLCERLLDAGNRVVCIDNFSTSHEQNINQLLQNADFQFLRLDVNEPIDLEKFPELDAFKIKFQGINEIYHLACPTTIKKFDQFKMQTLLSNSIGNQHVLDLAVRYKSKILLSSSAVVYGPRREGVKVFKEDSEGILDHLSPRACYDEGRRFSETMFETYSQVHGIEIKIARIFRTYGPRMPLFDGHMIPDFVLNAIDGKELVIYGDEKFSTSLVYVTDVVDGLVRLMASGKEVKLVNIGSDVDLPIADVAKKVVEMVGSASPVKFEPPLLFLTSLGLPDITCAKESLGWLPLVRLEDGLRKTIEYVKANKILLTSM